jgi:hypothetical protein
MAQPCSQVVHHQYHWSYVVGATSSTKRIHSIRTQRKPNIFRVILKFQIVLLIEFLPPPSISWMSELFITFSCAYLNPTTILVQHPFGLEKKTLRSSETRRYHITTWKWSGARNLRGGESELDNLKSWSMAPTSLHNKLNYCMLTRRFGALYREHMTTPLQNADACIIYICTLHTFLIWPIESMKNNPAINSFLTGISSSKKYSPD